MCCRFITFVIFPGNSLRLFDTHSFLLLMRSWCFLLLFMYSSVCTPLLFLNLIATLILKIWNYWGWKSPICRSIWIFKCLLGQVEMEKKEYVKSTLKYFHAVNKNYTIIILYPYWILRQWNCLACTTLQNQNKQTNRNVREALKIWGKSCMGAWRERI